MKSLLILALALVGTSAKAQDNRTFAPVPSHIVSEAAAPVNYDISRNKFQQVIVAGELIKKLGLPAVTNVQVGFPVFSKGKTMYIWQAFVEFADNNQSWGQYVPDTRRTLRVTFTIPQSSANINKTYDCSMKINPGKDDASIYGCTITTTEEPANQNAIAYGKLSEMVKENHLLLKPTDK